MHQASLYQRANNVQRRDAKQILQQYADTIQWRSDGHDSLVDIGCGSGNVLMDFIYPILPEQFERLLGTDISPKMVNFARKQYDNDERVQFEVLDIAAEHVVPELCEQFDHVTSFYCMHWIQDQRRALRNIYQLLRIDGGDCLLVFLASNPIYDVYQTVSKMPKWSAYMQDVEKFISPLHYAKDPSAEYGKLLEEAGFSDHRVEIRNEIYIYEGVENVKNNIKAICPFLERIPEKQHEDFVNDLVNTVASMNLREPTANMDDYKFIAPYKLVISYARKSSAFLSSVVDGERTAKGIE